MRSLRASNIDAWTREIEGDGLDAILITASGCGTTIKDYGFMLRNDPAYAEEGATGFGARQGYHRVSDELECAAAPARGIVVAYHSACSMQHGQQIDARAEGTALTRRLQGARRAGGPSLLRLGRHLQSAAAGDRARLRDRKVANIEKTAPDLIATGNIGCITQIGQGTPNPGRAHGRTARLGDRRASRALAPQELGGNFADRS